MNRVRISGASKRCRRHTTASDALKLEEVDENGRGCSDNRPRRECRPYLRAAGSSLDAIASRLVGSDPEQEVKTKDYRLAPMGFAIVDRSYNI